MLPLEETGFFVVEFKRAINENNNRVCVIPKAWKMCNIPKRMMAFGYPAGDEDSIAVRVMNEERRNSSWDTYLGVILSESESYEDAVGYLQTLSCEGNTEQIEGNSNQQSHEDAVGYDLTTCGENSEDNRNQRSHEDAVDLDTICGESSEQIEDNSNEKSHEDIVDLEAICGENSEQIEDNSNQKSHENAVGYLTTCGENSEDSSNQKSLIDAVGYYWLENSKQIEDNSNQKSHEDAVDLEKICEENSEQIEEKSNTMEPVTPTLSIGWPKVEEEEEEVEEPVTEPKHSLKVRIKVPKLDQKSEKKKKSEKKHHRKHLKEHSKHKVHKSKHRYLEQLLLTDNSTERSSPNSVDTGVGTASCMSCQSNCQSSESSAKSLESETSSSVHSAPETHLKNNNNNCYSSKRILLERLEPEKENHDGMLSEDRQLVEDLYIDIIRHVQYMKTTALEMKNSHLTAMENKKTLDKIAAKYRIPIHVTVSVEREKDRKEDLFEEENLQDDEMETQDDDRMENEAQLTEENDNTSEENLLEERENPEKMLESDSDNQIYTDDESPEDYLPPSPEFVVKYRGKAFSKANDICTLKHPGPGKGLIQIGRNSRIYISVKGLKRAKSTCTNVKKFARELFKEVFTHRALRTCSMNGFTRPPLHFKARTILKKYALKYGRDVGWDIVDPKELEQNLSKFLINTRRNILRKMKT